MTPIQQRIAVLRAWVAELDTLDREYRLTQLRIIRFWETH